MAITRCPFLLMENSTQACYVYITLESSLDDNYFSLLAGNPSEAFLLFDSIPVAVSGNDVKFYYYLGRGGSQPVEIYQHNFYDEITLYASVHSFSLDTPKSEWQYPTPQSYDYRSLETYQSFTSSSITIGEQDQCQEGECLVLIRAVREGGDTPT